MTGHNNPGGMWKDVEEGAGRRWVKVYEERVGKIYERHRCRVGGGGIGPAPKGTEVMNVQDFRLSEVRVLGAMLHSREAASYKDTSHRRCEATRVFLHITKILVAKNLANSQ